VLTSLVLLATSVVSTLASPQRLSNSTQVIVETRGHHPSGWTKLPEAPLSSKTILLQIGLVQKGLKHAEGEFLDRASSTMILTTTLLQLNSSLSLTPRVRTSGSTGRRRRSQSSLPPSSTPSTPSRPGSQYTASKVSSPRARPGSTPTSPSRRRRSSSPPSTRRTSTM
jgi:hypothetical protein